MSKEECEIALDYLFDNSLIDDYSNNIDDKMYDILKRMIEEHFKLKEKYSKILDDVHDYRYETHCMKMTMRNLCEHFGVKSEKELQNIYLNKPYKFEDLKPNMWVYDIKVKWLFKIVSVDIGIEALKHYVFIVENRDGSTSLINFEENRFFPVQCANLEIEN